MAEQKGYTICENKGVKFLQFDHIKKAGFTAHGFSTRIGGVSSPPFDTMNLEFTNRDKTESIKENRRRFTDALGLGGIELPHLIRLLHGNKVITDKELSYDGNAVEADGIITQKKMFPVATTFADCVPIILSDPVTTTVGVVHAGWRGTLASIASKAVDTMVNAYEVNPADILVGIGPGIGLENFIVGSDVISQFLQKYNSWKDLTVRISNHDKWKLDILELNRRILLDRGVSGHNIVLANICTYKREDLFFSYRRDGLRTGRMAAVIAITQNKS